MARRPLTIAIAPRSRANSTNKVLNVSTVMFGRSLVALRTKLTRSSAVNSVLPLRHGRLTTPTITSSNIAEARPITSRWPWVMGSKVPGQIAMRLSGVMNADQSVAVAALVAQRQFQLQRRPPIALGNDARARCQHGRQRLRKRTAEVGGGSIWGIEEDQIVLTRVVSCLPEARR